MQAPFLDIGYFFGIGDTLAQIVIARCVSPGLTLPFSFSRIRHRGFLAAKVKSSTLPLIRKLLGVEELTDDPCDSLAENNSSCGDTDCNEPQLKPPRCPKCGAKEMIWKAEIEPKVAWIRKRYSHYAFRARGAGFGMQAGPNPPRPP